MTYNADRQNINFSKHWHQIIQAMHLNKNNTGVQKETQTTIKKEKAPFFSQLHTEILMDSIFNYKLAALHMQSSPTWSTRQTVS